MRTCLLLSLVIAVTTATSLVEAQSAGAPSEVSQAGSDIRGVAVTPAPPGRGLDAAAGAPVVYYVVPAPEGAVATPTVRRWYGWQTLMTDGAALVSLGAMGLAFDSDQGALGAFMGFSSFGGYVFGGPIVHAAHGHWGKAAGSLALRVGAPLGLGATGYALESCEEGEWFCGFTGAFVGGILGISAAIALDAAVIARETIEVEQSVWPVAQVRSDGGWMGIAGTF